MNERDDVVSRQALRPSLQDKQALGLELEHQPGRGNLNTESPTSENLI